MSINNGKRVKMRSLSLLLGIVITAFGVFLIYLTSTSPSSAFNEITATLVILTGAVFLVGFGIIASIENLQESQQHKFNLLMKKLNDN